jgi:putative hemolysin
MAAMDTIVIRPTDPRAARAMPERALGHLGAFEVRLADGEDEIAAAQRLRYRVFFEEGGAIATPDCARSRRDADAFDAFCEHLLVIDHAADGRIAGTCRLLPQDAAEHCGFYSAGEFDIAPLLARQRQLRFLEIGRSCILAPYRNKRTAELLWHGVWAYVRKNRFDVMFGCASLDGTNPDALALPLAFLHHFARAPQNWNARPLAPRAVATDRVPKEAIDPRVALRLLPPLLKGYLRLGAFVGDGAVVDPQFRTTDVLTILPVAAINARYIGHFGADAERHAA